MAGIRVDAVLLPCTDTARIVQLHRVVSDDSTARHPAMLIQAEFVELLLMPHTEKQWAAFVAQDAVNHPCQDSERRPATQPELAQLKSLGILSGSKANRHFLIAPPFAARANARLGKDQNLTSLLHLVGTARGVDAVQLDDQLPLQPTPWQLPPECQRCHYGWVEDKDGQLPHEFLTELGKYQEWRTAKVMFGRWVGQCGPVQPA